MAEITVPGRASRKVAADQATLHLSFSTHGPERAKVLADATERHRALTARAAELTDAGRIDRYSAEELRTWSNWAQVGDNRVTEHFAQVNVSLTLSSLDEVGVLLTEFTNDDLDANVGWELSDALRLQTQRELRGEAVTSAKEAAEDYCAAIGLSVLTLRSIKDGQGGHSGSPMMARAMMADAMPIEVTIQDLEVSVSIEATYVAA